MLRRSDRIKNKLNYAAIADGLVIPPTMASNEFVPVESGEFDDMDPAICKKS